MLFSFPAPFWDCPLFSFFLSFFPLFSPKWGSPLMPRKGSGYRFPLPRLCPSAPPHLFTFLCPYLEISRPPPLCGVQTLSPPLQRKKAGPTHWNSLVLTLTSVCWLKAMSSRGGFAWALARTIFLAAALKVKDFFLLKQIRCRDCRLRNETRLTGQGGLFSLKKGGGASRLHAPCLKECYEKDLLGKKSPCGADP